jgi:hypothetical protein
LNRQQASAVNTLPLLTSSVANMELSASTMEELLRRDLDTALTMVGKLGEDKWKLEEKVFLNLIFDFRFSIFDFRFSIFDFRFSIFDFRFSIFDFQFLQ